MDSVYIIPIVVVCIIAYLYLSDNGYLNMDVNQDTSFPQGKGLLNVPDSSLALAEQALAPIDQTAADIDTYILSQAKDNYSLSGVSTDTYADLMRPSDKYDTNGSMSVLSKEMAAQQYQNEINQYYESQKILAA